MPEPRDESERGEWTRLIEGMSNNHRQAFVELWQDNYRIQVNGSPYGAWNLGPVINPCLARYAIKLIKALHVKAVGKPPPADAAIADIILSNGNIVQGEGVDLARMRLRHIGVVRRPGHNFADQFSWMYDRNDQAFVVKATFRQSFIIVGAVTCSVEFNEEGVPQVIQAGI